ncbi:hypothetical protein Q3G72_006657 [Acer saccharum]|nr:hypothetical protein Q3G72_006657 [Acer saccharum]
MSKSPAVSPVRKIVAADNNIRSRFRAKKKRDEIEKKDRFRRLERPISMQEAEEVGSRRQKSEKKDSFIDWGDRTGVGFNDSICGSPKRMSAALKQKNDVNMTSEEEDMGYYDDRPGPSNGGKCLGGQGAHQSDILRLEDGSMDRVNSVLDQQKGIEDPFGSVDPIVDCLAAKSPMGQVSLSSYELYVDLGSGIKVRNPSQPSKMKTKSSSGEERLNEDKLVRKSNLGGARGRGKRKEVSMSNHGMRTRGSSKRSAPTEVGGSEWDHEEVATRGEMVESDKQNYGYDGAWNVEEEVAKVLEIGALLGLKFVGNDVSMRKEIANREKEDMVRFNEL